MAGIVVLVAAAAIVKAVIIAKRIVLDLDWTNRGVKAG